MSSPPAPSEPRPLRRATATRLAGSILLLIVLVYVGAIAWLVTQETRIVFRAGRPLGDARPAFPYEQIELRGADGGRRIAWVMRNPDARAWVLFLHGNSATIASRVNIARYRELRALGLSVFAPEYRGFAGLPGVPTEAGLAEDARTAFAYLTGPLGVPPTRVVVYGWSLGSGVAVHLASEVQVAAVILEGAPASLVDIGQQAYPLFPIRLLMRNPFESILRIARVDAPLLFLHSPTDDIVPIAHGRRLYEAARGRKRFVEVRGGHIYANDVDAATFYGAIRAFLEDHGALGHEP